ncbi:MAG: collagen-like triple helix repeat-containing protein, partial [Wolbachia sp.]
LAGSPWSNRGSTWLQGDKGLPGFPGQNGAQGLAGSLWPKSDKGKQGPKEDMGNKGKIRVLGTDGASGMPGPKQPWQVKEHNYWQTTRQKLKELVSKGITKQFEEWRSKFSKEKIEEKKQELFNDLRRQIGTLKFTKSSPEIRDICDRYYNEIKKDVIAKHGYSGWSSVSHRVYREAIEPQIPKFIADLQAQKKAACHKQLSKLFEDELDELSRAEVSRLIDKFLEGNDKPLREHLVCHDRKLIAKKIKEVYPEHTINTLDKALNNSLSAISEIVDCETEKALKEHEKQLRVRLSGREKLEQSFTDLGFGDDTEEVNLEGTCPWVPASFRHDVEGGHSRTVYGGVCITGMANRIINPKLVKALARQTREVGKQAIENHIRGDALNKVCKEILTDLLSSDPRFEVRPGRSIETPFGKRILDLIVLKDGIPVQGIEIKAADSPYVRSDSYQAELLGRKPTKQGNADAWIEKEREKEGKGKSFPITEVRVEKLTKDHCKVQ